MMPSNESVKYLGVPLLSDYIHAAHYLPPLKKISSKLEGWDSNLLSIAGRAELIHSTIIPTVMYWILTYHLPVSILHKIDSMCVDFFWNGMTHKISWDTLYKPKLEGSIGIRKLSDLNITARLKLLWNLRIT